MYCGCISPLSLFPILLGSHYHNIHLPTPLLSLLLFPPPFFLNNTLSTVNAAICAWVQGHVLEHGQHRRAHALQENSSSRCSHQLPRAP